VDRPEGQHDPVFRFVVVGARGATSLEWVPPGSTVAFVEGESVRSRSELRLPEFDAAIVDSLTVPSEDRIEWTSEVLANLLSLEPGARILVRTEADGAELAREALRSGAWDVVPEDLGPSELVQRAEIAARLGRVQREGPSSTFSAEERDDGDDGDAIQMVGTSPEMRSVFSLIRRVSRSDAPVLITGESGTGKELTALAIHERSLRAEGPFVPINCAAIPESLLEAELFGYERGAFTDATQARPGRLETAQGGTVFLDEIGDLPPLFQVKLLRFLQDHVIERVGGSGRIPLDVRVLAATNRDLHALVANGRFREDLYYRLAVVPLHMPPLRDRGDDVALMACHYLGRYAREAGKDLPRFSSDAIDALLEWEWPGNIRELINRVRRAVVVAEGPEVDAADLGLDETLRTRSTLTLREARRRAEIECIRAALERKDGNKAGAARSLGISRTQLYELMHRYRIASDGE
jgi:two-component system NtrC family response regulator